MNNRSVLLSVTPVVMANVRNYDILLYRDMEVETMRPVKKELVLIRMIPHTIK